MENNDAAEDEAGGGKTKEEIAYIAKGLKEHKERYQGYAKELGKTGNRQKSLADADNRFMTTDSQKMDVCYNIQPAADAKNKFIVEFEAGSQGNDKNFIAPMAKSSQELLGTQNIAVVADAGYESIKDIIDAGNQGVDAHVAGTDFYICLPAKEGEATDISSRHEGRCVCIAERNIALCPMGNVLYQACHTMHKQKGPRGVFYSYRACKRYACKRTTDARGRFQYKIPMAKEDFSKEHNDRSLLIKQVRIKPDKEIVRQRKSIVEHPFGTVKRSMDSGYCLTKRLGNALGEFSLAFLAYNLKRAINILGYGKLIESMA